jgi:aminoglycoside phosphotransferase (APT) family kinase protein
MGTGKMHAGEVHIDAALVGRLIAEQFPRWADLPIRAVRSTGTVNALFRLGGHLCARLPRVEEWAQDLGQGVALAPKLAPHLSLRVPEPIGKGHPTSSYPFSWAVYGWIDGRPYTDDLVDDEQQAVRDLARFVAELRRIDPAGAPRSGRRPLRELDAVTRAAIEAARGVIDGDAATAAWERRSKRRPGEERRCGYTPTLLRPNVLVRDGQLRAVIDSDSAKPGWATPTQT